MLFTEIQYKIVQYLSTVVSVNMKNGNLNGLIPQESKQEFE